MLGLIEKDLRLTLARKQTLLVFSVMALIMGISMDGSFTIGYLTILATIIAVGTISYDEFDNGFAFLMTLPFSRKTYVREKYLFSFCMTAAAWCVGAVLYFIGNVIRHNAAILPDEFPMLIALIPVMYLSAVIMIPLQLKYGSEKSRVALLIIFGIIAILIFGSTKLFGSSNILAGLTKTLDGLPPTVVLPALSAVCALAAYVSWLCSIRVMEKKEF